MAITYLRKDDVESTFEEKSSELGELYGPDFNTPEKRNDAKLAKDDTFLALISDYDDCRQALEALGDEGDAIYEHSMEEYAQEYAEGQMDGLDRWPCIHIDWERAASDLESDMRSFEYGGDTYYIR